jgi:hypothetical protein
MSARLRLLELATPERVARAGIRALFEATASAFGTEVRVPRGTGRRALIERYARFTSRAADGLQRRADADLVERRLWANANALGVILRRRLGVRTRADALRAVRLAYRMLDIDLRADDRGDVVVERCPFAARYAPTTCRLMSCLDAGLISGLTSGGRLSFSQRITDGRPRCLATIAFEDDRA